MLLPTQLLIIFKYFSLMLKHYSINKIVLNPLYEYSQRVSITKICYTN